MSRPTTGLASFALVLVSGCAATPEPVPVIPEDAPTVASDPADVALAAGSGAPDEAGEIRTEVTTKVTCRYERVTGTHLVRKVCLNEEQREELEEEAQEAMRRITRPGAPCATPGCN